MLGRRNPRESGRRLALAAGNDEHALFFGQSQYLVERDEHAVPWVEITQIERDTSVLLHRAARHRDLAAVLFRRQERHVYSADIRREGGDDHLAARFLNHAIDSFEHDALGGS
jgi:hypothetical protein